MPFWLIKLPVAVLVVTITPFLALLAMAFCVTVLPLDVSMATPLPPLPSAVDVATTPMRLKLMVVPVGDAPKIEMPFAPLPEIVLASPALPPMVVPLALPSTVTPSPVLGIADGVAVLALALAPMMFWATMSLLPETTTPLPPLPEITLPRPEGFGAPIWLPLPPTLTPSRAFG